MLALNIQKSKIIGMNERINEERKEFERIIEYSPDSVKEFTDFVSSHIPLMKPHQSDLLTDEGSINYVSEKPIFSPILLNQISFHQTQTIRGDGESIDGAYSIYTYLNDSPILGATVEIDTDQGFEIIFETGENDISSEFGDEIGKIEFLRHFIESIKQIVESENLQIHPQSNSWLN